LNACSTCGAQNWKVEPNLDTNEIDFNDFFNCHSEGVRVLKEKNHFRMISVIQKGQ